MNPPQALDEQVTCNLCGAADHRLLYPDTRGEDTTGEPWEAFRCTHGGYGVHGPIVECLDCGLVYANPRPRAEAIETNYTDVEDPVYEEERGARHLTFRSHLKSLEKVVGKPLNRDLLDVGAHLGVFVEEAIGTGWKARGLEPSRWAVDMARRRGIALTRGFLVEEPFRDESFDIVTLWDVVEHLHAPLVELERCRKLTKSGGWLVVHTMDVGSFTARLLGRRWPWLMEMHLFYFDRKTLSSLLRRAGFEPVHIEAQSRFLRLGYLASRLEAFNTKLGRPARLLVKLLRLGSIPVPVSFGDLMTCYARKINGGSFSS